MAETHKNLLGDARIARATAAVSAWGIRTLMRTVPCDRVVTDPAAEPWNTDRGNIFCLWHEMMLPGAALAADRGIRVLVSQSRDGELITQIIERFGFNAIRGSSSRGAVRAVREMARSSDAYNLAITPDGPKGPRRQFQPGAVFLASRTGLPLVPLGFAFSRQWRLRSWDKMVIPKPFARSAFFCGEPIHVPEDADAETLAHYVTVAKDGMDRAEACAQECLRLNHVGRATGIRMWNGPVKTRRFAA